MFDLEGRMNRAGLFAAMVGTEKTLVPFGELSPDEVFISAVTGYLKKSSHQSSPYPHNSTYLNGNAAFLFGDHDLVESGSLK